MDTKNYFLPISILVTGILISGSVIYSIGARNGGGGTANVEQALNDSNPSANPTVSLKLTKDDVVLGDADAPVTMIIYEDFQCPFCQRLFSDAEPAIKDAYVTTGKVRLVSRMFPLDSIHPFARTAGEAGKCAADQGAYWKYRDTLFTRQSQLSTIDFVALAGELGLETKTFRTCYEGGKHKALIEEEYQSGLTAGVRGTPASFVNGVLISGAQPFTAFKAAIEAALAQEQ
ncbi:MAG: DsbA family protein [bacterium]|nr:DsbA family protein [bacterium]